MSREEQWSQKGKKAYVDRKVGECFQWKSHGQCSKGDSCGFSHELASGNRGGGQRRKGQSSSPAPNSKAKTDGEVEKPSKESGNIDESSSDKKEQHSVPIQKLLKKSRLVVFWHPPVCQNYKSKTGCTFGNKCYFRDVEADKKPSKKSKNGVALLKESLQLGCASQDSYPRKSILREQGKLGSNRTVKFTNDTCHQIKNLERKGPSRGIIQKCEPLRAKIRGKIT